MLVGGKAVPVPGKCLACCRHSTDDCGTGVTSQLCTSHPLPSSPGPTMRRAWKPPCVCANLRLWVQWIRAPSRLARERRRGWLGGGMVGVLFSQPGQLARLLGTALPAPAKAALGRRLHLDFVGHVNYTHSYWNDTKPKRPHSPRLRQALPGASHSRLPLCELSPPARPLDTKGGDSLPAPGLRSYWHVPSPWLPASGAHEVFHF